MKKLKVLYSWHGAVEPGYRKFFTEIVNNGIDARLISPSGWTEGGKFQEFTPAPSDNFNSVVLHTAFTNRVRGFFYPNIIRLAAGIKSFSPDIIHIMEEPFSLAAYEQIRLARIFAPSSKIVLFSFENIDIRQKLPYSVFQAYNLRQADAIIIVPEESLGIWRKRGFSKRIAKIPLWVDTSLFGKMDRNEASRLSNIMLDNTFKIGYVGRVTEEKGIETAVEALKTVNGKGMRCDLYMAGGGSHKESLINKANGLNIGHQVHFLGPIDQSGLSAFYNSIDALVLPSLTTSWWKEQFGRVLVEAMACGTPVIGSSSGEIPNVIGKAGLVFREGDSLDLAGKVERLNSDNALKEAIIKKGIQKVRDEFSLKAVASEYITLYKELLGKKAKR